MKAIVVFITVQVAAVIGYYLGRFLASFAINKFTYRFLCSLDGRLANLAPEWVALRRVQRFASAGAGAFAALAVWVFSQQLEIVTTQVPARNGRAPEGIGPSQLRQSRA
jgi:hypothetical protein